VVYRGILNTPSLITYQDFWGEKDNRLCCVSAATTKLCALENVLIPFNIIKRRITGYTHLAGSVCSREVISTFQEEKKVKDLEGQQERTWQNDEKYLSHTAPKGKGKQHLCHSELEEQGKEKACSSSRNPLHF